MKIHPIGIVTFLIVLNYLNDNIFLTNNFYPWSSFFIDHTTPLTPRETIDCSEGFSLSTGPYLPPYTPTGDKLTDNKRFLKVDTDTDLNQTPRRRQRHTY